MINLIKLPEFDASAPTDGGGGTAQVTVTPDQLDAKAIEIDQAITDIKNQKVACDEAWEGAENALKGEFSSSMTTQFQTGTDGLAEAIKTAEDYANKLREIANIYRKTSANISAAASTATNQQA